MMMNPNLARIYVATVTAAPLLVNGLPFRASVETRLDLMPNPGFTGKKTGARERTNHWQVVQHTRQQEEVLQPHGIPEKDLPPLWVKPNNGYKARQAAEVAALDELDRLMAEVFEARRESAKLPRLKPAKRKVTLADVAAAQKELRAQKAVAPGRIEARVGEDTWKSLSCREKRKLRKLRAGNKHPDVSNSKRYKSKLADATAAVENLPTYWTTSPKWSANLRKTATAAKQTAHSELSILASETPGHQDESVFERGYILPEGEPTIMVRAMLPERLTDALKKLHVSFPRDMPFADEDNPFVVYRQGWVLPS